MIISQNGKTVAKAKIPRYGDLLGNIFLRFELPVIDTNQENFRWIKNIGDNIINEVFIEFGDVKIDTIYGEWLYLWNELSMSVSVRGNIGSSSSASLFTAGEYTTALDEGTDTLANLYTVPDGEFGLSRQLTISDIETNGGAGNDITIVTTAAHGLPVSSDVDTVTRAISAATVPPAPIPTAYTDRVIVTVDAPHTFVVGDTVFILDTTATSDPVGAVNDLHTVLAINQYGDDIEFQIPGLGDESTWTDQTVAAGTVTLAGNMSLTGTDSTPVIDTTSATDYYIIQTIPAADEFTVARADAATPEITVAGAAGTITIGVQNLTLVNRVDFGDLDDLGVATDLALSAVAAGDVLLLERSDTTNRANYLKFEVTGPVPTAKTGNTYQFTGTNLSSKGFFDFGTNSYDLNVWQVTDSDQSILSTGYNRLIGNDYDLIEPAGSNTIESRELYVPIEFWFHKNPGLAVPLVALQYQEITLTFSLRPWNELFIIDYEPAVLTDEFRYNAVSKPFTENAGPSGPSHLNPGEFIMVANAINSTDFSQQVSKLTFAQQLTTGTLFNPANFKKDDTLFVERADTGYPSNYFIFKLEEDAYLSSGATDWIDSGIIMKGRWIDGYGEYAATIDLWINAQYTENKGSLPSASPADAGLIAFSEPGATFVSTMSADINNIYVNRIGVGVHGGDPDPSLVQLAEGKIYVMERNILSIGYPVNYIQFEILTKIDQGTYIELEIRVISFDGEFPLGAATENQPVLREVQYDVIGLNISRKRGDASLGGVYNTNISNYTSAFSTNDIDISAKLIVDYIFLDEEERNKFAKETHEYLIEQHRLIEYKNVSIQNNLRLYLHHMTKNLIWVTQRDDILTRNNYPNEWNNYTSVISNDYINAENILTNAKLTFEGVDRLDYHSGDYYNLIEPTTYFTSSPEMGVYAYSFSLDNTSFQPLGAANLSAVNNIELTAETIAASGGVNYNIRTYGTNYNVLRILSGIGGVAYGN